MQVIPNKTIRIFPKVLEKYITNESLFYRLVGMRSYTQKLMDQNFELIVQLRFPPNPRPDYDVLSHFYANPKWQLLKKLNALVIAEQKKVNIQKPTSFFGKLFQPSKLALIHHWQGFLLQQQKQMAKQMLSYATFISEQLRTRLDLELDYSLLCSKSFSNYVEIRIYPFNDYL